MRYEFKKSFKKCIKRLPEGIKIEIKEIIFEVIDVV